MRRPTTNEQRASSLEHRATILLSLFLLAAVSATAQTAIITTVAGSGDVIADGRGGFKVIGDFSGDGGPATGASLNFPRGVAVDASGNLFIADSNNFRIRRVDAATGIITTVAGNGSFGFSGDGGPATSASLSFPSGVAVDAAGNLFIADQGNNRIRRVDAATGIITTVVDGFHPVAVAVDAGGNLFFADVLVVTFSALRSKSTIFRVDAATGDVSRVAGTLNGVGFTGDGGSAREAFLLFPFGLAVDAAGNLFIADSGFVFGHLGGRRIRRVDAATGIITTVAGNGGFDFSGDGGSATSASLSNPFGVAVDAAGNLYIADQDNQRIRRVDAGADGQVTGASDETITTVAGTGLFGFSGDGGPATGASLANPFGVAVDAAGNLYIADEFNQRIRRVILSVNQPPVADAGPDQEVGCTSVSATNVLLDASGSSDPDGDPLTFLWTLPGGSTATGVNPTVSLPLGTHTITLVVNDGVVDSPPDSVNITVKVGVVGLQPPLAALAPEGQGALVPDHAFKQGRTLPLKLQLFCGMTALTDADVSPPRIVALFRASDAIDLTTIDPDAGEANDSGLLFRYSDPNWVYNLGTQGLSAGTYLITLEMPDGLRYTAVFVLR